MARGTLRIYVGAAPGVGKTYTMLEEGLRRRERGADVVLGVVEDHGRAKTRALIEGYELIPRRTIEYRGSVFTEMDLDAVLARAPKVALVDELAHTNVPGSRNEKRWQDVDELLDAGIDVISTVNVQHLESLNDVVERITGVVQRETIPDEVVRRAEQVELVDMAPEALRRRMAHGNIYAAEKIDSALSSYFRPGNLTALRELALLWTADRVDEALRRYRQDHQIEGVWEARERVVVALTGGPEGETLIRRGARIAARGGAELLAVHVARSDGLAGSSPAALAQQRALVESLGGSFHSVVGDDVSRALLDFAGSVNATQLVLGVSRKSRLASVFAGEGIGERTTRLSGPIDVHMVTHDYVGRDRMLPRLRGGLGMRRNVGALILTAILLPALTLLLDGLEPVPEQQTVLLLYLAAVVGIALLGGLLPAIVAAIAASLLVNWFFVPPIHTFTISDGDSAFALFVFVAVAGVVSTAVHTAARRSRQAARARAEASTLSALAGSVLRGQSALPAMLNQLQETFGFAHVELDEREDPDGEWVRIAEAGEPPPAAMAEAADTVVDIDERRRLVARGRLLAAEDRRVLTAFAIQAAAALDSGRMAERVAQARELERADALRTALLAAVGHDLRTPLAGIKAAVSSLRQDDVPWSEQDEAALLETIEQSADRLGRLIADLLDMSRLQAGELSVHARPVALDEVVPGALRDLPAGARVEIDVDESLPPAEADPALLERVIANLLSNAVRHSPENEVVLVKGLAVENAVELRVIDRGPGIPPDQREHMFAPFQRLGDRDNVGGIGLGLAVARGFTEAMDGRLEAEDTPGGGLTMILGLPAARSAPIPASSGTS